MKTSEVEFTNSNGNERYPRALKTTPDGTSLLQPQLSDDQNDPLNWPKAQKMLILLVVSVTAFLPDFGSSMGAVTSVVQSNLRPGGTWDIPQTVVNHSLVGNLFMLGAGGIAVVSLSAYFGRAPIMFWFLIVTVCTAAWCGAATTFPSFMAARIVNGFFATVGQAGGLMFINDMFFFHDHPYRTVAKPPPGDNSLASDSAPFSVIVKLPVLLSFGYYIFTFAWVIGLNTQISVFLTNPKLYNFSDKDIGLFYFAPIIATILGELAGHWIHDFAGEIYRRYHAGRFEPEARLLPIYPATLIMILGIVLVGVGLQRVWHYMLIAVSMGLFVFGIMIVTTAINAYVLDCYPEAPGEVSAWINAGRTVGGFILTYFEVVWAETEGTQKTLGIQAAIVLSAVFVFVVPLQVWGSWMRGLQKRIEF
ncbi:hypothetical protein MMC28_006683 [Mycoblastus sanguinarius]|nr:hypothetical protein [Mycoblastus sanguinarius]